MGRDRIRISSGSHSINLGAANSISSSNFHVGDVNNYRNVAPETDDPLLSRVQSKALTITGKPIKATWLTISGLVGFIGSIASIVSLWPNFSLWLVGLLPFFTVFYLIGFALQRYRFIRLPYVPFNLEADRNGKIFITRLEGNCPQCDGKLKLRDTKFGDYTITDICCTRNIDHNWKFDFTRQGEPRC
jgi:hypothetical protein